MELSDLINNGQALGETAPGVFGGLDVLTEAEASGTYAAKAGAGFTGDAPVAVDSVTAAALVTLPDGAVNGFVVKVAAASTGYGRGQPFMVVEAGPGDATDATAAGSVLFRVDENGGVGLAGGGIHIAAGFRKASGGTQALWVDPSENIIGVLISNPTVAEQATWDKNFFQVSDVRAGTVPFRIASTGEPICTLNMTAREGATTKTFIGEVYGYAGLGMGSTADTILYRKETAIIGVGNCFEFPEMVAPAAAPADRARLFCRDNGAGKTQVCAIFSSGAIQVMATQP